MLKKLAIIIVVLVGLFYGGFHWLKSLLPEKAHFVALKQTQSSDLAYLTENIPAHRGKILAVVTSVDKLGDTGKTTGYELTELARAYWVFTANGFEVDIASPMGGHPPRVLDGEDMGAFDYAFINDESVQAKVENSIKIDDINPLDYEAVYFVGGKGTMFDFPDNPAIKEVIKTLHENNRVISAVCHGPAALLNVELDDGELFLSNKAVSSFTNEEELFLIPDAEEVFPFLLETKITEQGGEFKAGLTYMEKVTRDGKLITGQNPWSVWKMSEMVVEALGYEPKPRKRTPEEYSVDLLMTYQAEGYDAAVELLKLDPESYQRVLVVMHGIVAFMEIEPSKGIDILRLASELKNLSE